MPGVGLDMATMASSNTCSSNLAGTVPPSTGAAAATAEDAVKLHALRPLEELTEADIRQLTREDCRRYLKERGMRRPSWNKAQAIQQVLSLKSLMYSSSSKSSSAKAGGATAPATESPGRGVVTILSQEHGRTVSPLLHAAQTKELLDKVGPSHNNGNSNNNNASDPRPPVTAFGVPQHQAFLSSPPQDSGGVKAAAPVLPLGSAPGGAHRAQLTIFYSGIVNVYDDVPLEKAQAIMLLASSKAFQVPTPLLPAVAPLLQLQREPVPPPPPPPGNRCYVSPFLSTTTEPIGATPPASVNNTQHEESTDPGLPQARTVSLQRFLAKRRERISANPSYYRRSEKQSSKRSKPSSSPPPPTPLQLVSSRAASPLLSTTSSHNIPKHSTSDFSSRSRSTASSDTSGGSFRTTATTTTATTTTTTTATMTFTGGGGGNHSFYPIAGHSTSQKTAS